MAERRNNSGTLGRNKRKEKETHPDHKGQATIDGVDYWISGWVRDGTDGRFFSLAFERKDKERSMTSSSKPVTAKSASPVDGEDNDIPF
jgi:hypothetical protein